MAFVYSKPDPDYDHDDYYITEPASRMRFIRNVHMLIGFGVGVVATIATAYIWLWTIGLL